jgi:hypothetical protein
MLPIPDVHALVNGYGYITDLHGRVSLIFRRPGILYVMTLGGAFEFSGCSDHHLDHWIKCGAWHSSRVEQHFPTQLSTVIVSKAPAKFSFLSISLLM